MRRRLTVSTFPSNALYQGFFAKLFGSSAAAEPTKDVASMVSKNFPRAVTNAELVDKVSSALAPYGFGESTLVATSLCCDEVNRVLDLDFGKRYNINFSMGGLAGFAFGGVTSFGAMAHHIPDGGSCLIVYGPHVGIDYNGKVGSVNRRGRAAPGGCCGSALAAHGHVCAVHKGEAKAVDESVLAVPEEHQQALVGKMLMPYAERLVKSPEPMVELPLALYDAQKKMMDSIVAAGCQEVAGEGKIALLGGVQINTPEAESDYFLPLNFEIRSNKNDAIKDLMWK
jgi:Limiting CO2-inducible proteins B/C beta carbonyic anhydrases